MRLLVLCLSLAVLAGASALGAERTGVRRDPPQVSNEGDIGAEFTRALSLARQGESIRAADLLEALARRLREGVGLAVRSVTLAERVDGYGVYARDPRRSFAAGDRVMVYAEVVGFRSRELPPPEQGYALSLEATFELASAVNGDTAGVWGPETVEQASMSEMRDLFLTRVIALPSDLKPGVYELRVRVADRISGESARGAVVIHVL